PLARHFISVYRTRLGLDDIQLTPEAQERLLSYGWPGNIRELENVIHFALIVCRDGVIQAGDIKLVPLAAASSGAAAAPGLTVGGLGALPDAPPVGSLSPEGGRGPTQPEAAPVAAQPQAPVSSLSARDAALPADAVDGLRALGEVLSRLIDEGHAELFDQVESALVHVAFEH